MIFKQMLPGQKLILARVETRQPPARPVVARSAHRPDPDPAIVRFVLWLVAILRPVVEPLYADEAKERQKRSEGRGKKGVEKIPHLKDDKGKARDKAAKAVGTNGQFLAAIRTNYAALAILASVTATVLLETLAAGYIQKMVGA